MATRSAMTACPPTASWAEFSLICSKQFSYGSRAILRESAQYAAGDADKSVVIDHRAANAPEEI